MSDQIIDSSVIAKWFLPETDRVKALALLKQTDGGKLIVLDIVYAEVANAIWKLQRRKLLSEVRADAALNRLLRVPVEVVKAHDLLASGYTIAKKYDRAVYDALFSPRAASGSSGYYR